MYLITGGAGYIGSHMVYKLLDEGHNVLIFDNLETGHMETIQNILNYSKNAEFLKGDLKNKKDTEEIFKNRNIKAVVHFAAYSIVPESVKNPAKYWENNVYGTINLLNSMLAHNTNKIVFSSTCATYGEPTYTPIDEKHPQNPVNPYGKTKLAVEKIMDDYDRAYGLKSVRLRYFNVAGADPKLRTGEWHTIETHLIPNILKSTLYSNKVFEIFGDDYPTPDGTCIRDYIDMQDLTEAHLLALKYLENGGATDYFNLGTKTGSSVKEVFACAGDITGKKIDFKIQKRREGDPAILIGNSSKAEKILGWKPKYTLKDSVKNAFAWENKLKELL